MKTSMLVSIALGLGSVLPASTTYAQGFMAFLPNGTAGTTVTVGDAASYMRAGVDWDGIQVNGGVATPTLLQAATINTWRDGAALHFGFVIADRTTSAAGGGTLACGDQVIIQIDPTNSKAANLSSGNFMRYEVVIKNLQVVGGVTRRTPVQQGAAWKWSTLPTATSATITNFGAANDQYQFSLTIPLNDIGSPTTDFGLALAIINDLGHSHSAGVNEASGTAFPVSMGLTPESEPGLTCGVNVPKTEDATGNWVKPSTWGTGYRNVATAAQTVALSHTPAYWISNSIKLGRCGITQWGQIAPINSASNWEAVQQNSLNNWYLYNPGLPCRMGIWVNAQVTPGPGVATRRFLVVWGRPGISPQDWYFAGLTDPVAVTAPATALSFIWNDPPAVTFSSHPCLRVYVLPENLSAAQITTLQGIDTQAELAAMEATYGVSPSTLQSAQMNFANIGSGNCTDTGCMPLAISRNPGVGRWPEITLASARLTDGRTAGATQTARPDNRQGDRKDTLERRIRIVAQAFGVAEPTANKPYVYVERIGGLGWSLLRRGARGQAVAAGFRRDQSQGGGEAVRGRRSARDPGPAQADPYLTGDGRAPRSACSPSGHRGPAKVRRHADETGSDGQYPDHDPGR